MISVKFRVVLAAAVLLYFVVLYTFIRKGKLLLKYALVWIFAGSIMSALVVFPGILKKAADFIGIYNDINLLFFFLTAFILMIVMSLTMIVSGMNESIKKIVQRMAVMEDRIEQLEKSRKEESIRGINDRSSGI